MTWKRSLKRTVVRLGRAFARQDRRVILCYHSVNPLRWDLSSDPDVFESHLAWLTRECRVVGLRELVATRPDGPVSAPIVALTFDDGYEDNLTVALPLLRKHGLPATFFVTPGLVERDPLVLDGFSRALRRDVRELGLLTWPQVAEIRRAGMDIGNHTYSHRNLAQLALEDARREVLHAADLLSEHLGERVELFAYPFGRPRVHFTRETEEIVLETGHEVAFSALYREVRASDPVSRIPRLFVDGDELEKLRDKVFGAYDIIGWWQEHMPIPLLRALSPDLGRRFV
jgi:peptidoglycan/xylan/chitin deacetylase (PgdA/CDA1 family)